MTMTFRHGHACTDGPLVCFIAGDDAAPEALLPTVALLHELVPGIRFREAGGRRAARKQDGYHLPKETRQLITAADCTLLGASGEPSWPILWHLRWGMHTAVNVRPIRWRPGYRSPLQHPEQINYVIVYDNLEGLSPPREGDLNELPLLPSSASWDWAPEPAASGAYAVRICTDAQIRRVAATAIHLAYERQSLGSPGCVTLGAHDSLQPRTDGRFRQLVREMVAAKAGLTYQEFPIDDLVQRMVAEPEKLDVVVLNTEQGNILAQMAAGCIGGPGLAPGACYGEDYAYFEPAHGSAVDLAGKDMLNPTATLLTGALLLDYLGYIREKEQLEDAVARVYRQGNVLPTDQGGQASTSEFFAAVRRAL